MKKFLPPMILLLAAAALAPACGAVSNGGNPTPSPSPTGGNGIAAIQQGQVAEGSSVTLEGIIVTAVDASGNAIDFWAQDAGGGAYSGILFFDGNQVTPAEIAVGDEVTVSGSYTEFDCTPCGGGPWADSVSEINIESVTITGTGTVTVDTIPVADLAEELNGTAAEEWEGCLLQIGGDVDVVAASTQFGQFNVTNGGEQIIVDDQLYSDAELGRFAGETLTVLRGIWDYSFDEYKLEPRDAADIVGEVLAPVNVTVAMIQNTNAAGHPVPGQTVILNDVVVTGAWQSGGATPRRHLVISDSTTPAIYTGIVVFNENASQLVPLTVTTGYVVDITGTYKEFQGVSEVALNTAGNPAFTVVSSVASAATPLMVNISDLLANPEQYEGTLIQLNSGATITAVGLGGNQFRIDDGTGQFLVDDFIWTDAEVGRAVTDTLTLVRGVVHHSVGATFNDYKINPRSPLDLVE